MTEKKKENMPNSSNVIKPYLHHTPSCRLKDLEKGTFGTAMTSFASIAWASYPRHLHLFMNIMIDSVIIFESCAISAGVHRYLMEFASVKFVPLNSNAF